MPGSNAFVERFFSLMTIETRLTEQMQHRADQKLLQISVNCDLSCKDFSLAVQKDKGLLGSVKSRTNIHGKKYTFMPLISSFALEMFFFFLVFLLLRSKL